jgi:hypothetical protein
MRGKTGRTWRLILRLPEARVQSPEGLMTSLLLFGDMFVTTMAALLGVFAPVSPVIWQGKQHKLQLEPLNPKRTHRQTKSSRVEGELNRKMRQARLEDGDRRL